MLGFNEVRTTNETLTAIFQRKLKAKLQSLLLQQGDQPEYNLENPFVKSLKDDLQVNDSLALNLNQIWPIAKKWVRARQTIAIKAPELGTILNAMQTAKILKSDVSRKGTQLKLLLTLEGGQYALFKPKRYSRDYITEGYAGADRHNGEIFGMFVCIWIAIVKLMMYSCSF